MLMALTGGLYLFKDEISGVLYRRLLTVPPSAAQAPPSAWIASAERGLDGEVLQLTPLATPDLSVQMLVQRGDGEKLSVYVDPHDARLLGSTPQGGVMGVVKRLHSLDLLGPVANWGVEIVAGWAIVLVATGVFLWWPRDQSAGVVTVRGPLRKRVFWRDLHAVTGLFAGVVIVFLAATGMPWSAFWGQEVRKITTEAGLGRPT
ncbi:MAG TPA: PepSY domain-containing protein, partial [Caulobacter sp.]|nr:PepSY domain-containing protein [Caulobacter sp.]